MIEYDGNPTGIVGFGTAPDSELGRGTVFDDLLASGAVKEDVFAVCYHAVRGRVACVQFGSLVVVGLLADDGEIPEHP